MTPDQNLTLTFTAGSGTADGSYPFEIQGIDTRITPAAPQIVSLSGTLIVDDLPDITSVSPENVPTGRSTTVTIQGTDMENADVWGRPTNRIRRRRTGSSPKRRCSP